jgi:hypothetical protein
MRVQLDDVRVKLAGKGGSLRRLKEAHGHNDLLSLKVLITSRQQVAIPFPRKPIHSCVEPDGEGKASSVVLQVVGHLIFGWIRTWRGRERQAGQTGNAGPREEA